MDNRGGSKVEVAMKNEIRKSLEHDRDRITEALKEKGHPEFGEKRGLYGDRAAASMVSNEIGKGVSIEQRLKEQLADIEHALSKLDDGTYGICDSCGEPIPEGRMKVIPHANLCVECKSKQT
jgi:DnaK suppressor protein